MHTTTAPKRLASGGANRQMSLDALPPAGAGTTAKKKSPVKPTLIAPPGTDVSKPRPAPKTPPVLSPDAVKHLVKKPALEDIKPTPKTVQKAPPKSRRQPISVVKPWREAPPKPKDRFHTVEKYDTFAILAEKYYGTQGLAGALLKANPHVTDPRLLKLGTKLRIPPKSELVKPARGADRQAKAAAKDKAKPARSEPKVKYYTVQRDDSFYYIARKVWGDGTRWPELLDLNRDICSTPRALRPGMKLRLSRPKAVKAPRRSATIKRPAESRKKPKAGR